jgi:hypothetical protein
VLCRWPWEQGGSTDREGRSARLLDIVRLLPSGTEVGVGDGWQVSLCAGDEAQLHRRPTLHNLTEVRGARLDRAGWHRWGIDDRVATDALGNHVLLRAVAPGVVQYLVVASGADQARRDGLVTLCRDHRLRDSLQLWELDQLPRWARRRADDLLAESHN